MMRYSHQTIRSDNGLGTLLPVAHRGAFSSNKQAEKTEPAGPGDLPVILH